MIINSILCTQQSLRCVYIEIRYKVHVASFITMGSADSEAVLKIRV